MPQQQATIILGTRKQTSLRGSGLLPMRPGVALFFVLFPGEGFDAEPLRAFLADGHLGRLAANVADMTGVFRSGPAIRDGLRSTFASSCNFFEANAQQ